MFINLKLSNLAYGIFIALGLGYLLIIGAPILLPILYGLLFAMVVSPIEQFLRQKVKSKALSIFLSYMIIFVPIVLIIYVVSQQLSRIINNLPTLTETLEKGYKSTLDYIYETVPLLNNNRNLISTDSLQSLLDGPVNLLSDGLISSSQGIFSIVLALIYAVFFLYYSKSFRAFFIYQFDKSSHPDIKETLSQIKSTVRSYIQGMGLVIIILSVLNTLGLWIIGIDYALFWGVLAGFLAIIPYVGTVIGGLLPLLYAIATSDYTWQPAAVAIYYFVVQQLEGNIITPKVVGKQVDLNPLISLFALVFFASIWGIGGIILALPITSVLRIILDHFENTKALAVLMGANIAEDYSKFKQIAEKS